MKGRYMSDQEFRTVKTQLEQLVPLAWRIGEANAWRCFIKFVHETGGMLTCFGIRSSGNEDEYTEKVMHAWGYFLAGWGAHEDA
jgi:hypothetical protein